MPRSRRSASSARCCPCACNRGAARSTKRHFPVKLPVALDSARALFVYADPGHDTATALRSLGQRRTAGLWRALRGLGRSVEVVAVARTGRELERARRVTRGWAEPGGLEEPEAGAAEELARIERAPLGRGPHPRGVRRSPSRPEAQRRAREADAPPGRPRGSIDRRAAWRSERLARVRLPMSGVPAMPHRGVKTTRGVVSRIGRRAIHMRPLVHPIDMDTPLEDYPCGKAA